MDVKKRTLGVDLSKRHNNKLLPKCIRGIICGSSGSGKTNLLFNLLTRPWLDYNNLMIFGKNLLSQRDYLILKKCFDEQLPKDIIDNLFDKEEQLSNLNDENLNQGIEQLAIGISKKSDIKFTIFNSGDDDVPEPGELDKTKNNLMIFDDLMCEKKATSTCEKYYVRGRHMNTDCFFLSQDYFEIPLHTIRRNSNLLILFSQDGGILNHIHKDHCTDISLEEFKRFCKSCWMHKHNFVTIDLSSEKSMGKYRMNFDMFYIPNT